MADKLNRRYTPIHCRGRRPVRRGGLRHRCCRRVRTANNRQHHAL